MGRNNAYNRQEEEQQRGTLSERIPVLPRRTCQHSSHPSARKARRTYTPTRAIRVREQLPRPIPTRERAFVCSFASVHQFWWKKNIGEMFVRRACTAKPRCWVLDETGRDTSYEAGCDELPHVDCPVGSWSRPESSSQQSVSICEWIVSLSWWCTASQLTSSITTQPCGFLPSPPAPISAGSQDCFHDRVRMHALKCL